MERKTREAILRTALVTANKKAGWKLSYADEFVQRVCDAEEEQEKHDAQRSGDEFNKTSRAIADLAHEPR